MFDSWSAFTAVIAGFGTLAIFSFLIKENALYRFFEHLFIGIAAGLIPVLTFKNFLWPRIFQPMLGFTVEYYPDGTVANAYEPAYLLYLIPVFFGLLYYFIYSSRFNWLAKLVIGFSLGYSAGLSFKGFFAEVVPQITSSFKPLLVISDGSLDHVSSFNNIMFVAILLAVMYYFFFSFRRTSRASVGVSSFGRYALMVCFGAFFGSTVMARLALLVDRIQFLLVDWIEAIGYLAW